MSGETVSDDPFIQMNVRVPKTHIEMCRVIARAQGKTLTEYMSALMLEGILSQRDQITEQLQQEVRDREQELADVDQLIASVEAHLAQ